MKEKNKQVIDYELTGKELMYKLGLKGNRLIWISDKLNLEDNDKTITIRTEE